MIFSKCRHADLIYFMQTSKAMRRNVIAFTKSPFYTCTSAAITECARGLHYLCLWKYRAARTQENDDHLSTAAPSPYNIVGYLGAPCSTRFLRLIAPRAALSIKYIYYLARAGHSIAYNLLKKARNDVSIDIAAMEGACRGGNQKLYDIARYRFDKHTCNVYRQYRKGNLLANAVLSKNMSLALHVSSLYSYFEYIDHTSPIYSEIVDGLLNDDDILEFYVKNNDMQQSISPTIIKYEAIERDRMSVIDKLTSVYGYQKPDVRGVLFRFAEKINTTPNKSISPHMDVRRDVFERLVSLYPVNDIIIAIGKLDAQDCKRLVHGILKLLTPEQLQFAELHYYNTQAYGPAYMCVKVRIGEDL